MGLTALAQQGYAPKIFTYVDKSGRPLPSVLIHLAAGALAYIQETSTGVEVFNWLLSLSGLAVFWIIGYLWKREGGLKIEQIDVDTGRREIDWDVINAYRAEVASWPKWKRIF